MPEVRFVIEDDEKNRIEVEASKLGVTQAGFFRLLFRNWIGEVKLERKCEPNNNSEKKE